MKLTKTQREKAVRLWADGWPMKEMARELGLTVKEIERETNYRRELYPYRNNVNGRNA